MQLAPTWIVVAAEFCLLSVARSCLACLVRVRNSDVEDFAESLENMISCSNYKVKLWKHAESKSSELCSFLFCFWFRPNVHASPKEPKRQHTKVSEIWDRMSGKLNIIDGRKYYIQRHTEARFLWTTMWLCLQTSLFCSNNNTRTTVPAAHCAVNQMKGWKVYF